MCKKRIFDSFVGSLVRLLRAQNVLGLMSKIGADATKMGAKAKIGR